MSTYNKDTDEIVTDIPMNWRNKKQVTAVLEERKIIKEEINESRTTIIDYLMKLFLSGEEIKPEDWKSKYLNYFINNCCNYVMKL